MTPETQAAAERLRRMRSGEVPNAVYSDRRTINAPILIIQDLWSVCEHHSAQLCELRSILALMDDSKLTLVEIVGQVRERVRRLVGSTEENR